MKRLKLILLGLLCSTLSPAQVVLQALEGSFSATKTASASRNYTKNNCGSGYTGTSVAYHQSATATATSSISQADADSQALTEAQRQANALVNNTSAGQAYANTYGRCNANYYTSTRTTSTSETFTKNDCNSGRGTAVTYTATATGYGRSSVSQAEADRLALADAQQKARDDIRRNGQNYANRNGSCERINNKCLELVYDKNYGDGDHNFIYCAVEGPNGKKWLNLNLGAEYAKESSPHFNPQAVPTDYNDWKASGSLFQYGRKADGHELVTYEKGTRYWYPRRVYPVINTPVNSINSPKNYVDIVDAYWANDIPNWQVPGPPWKYYPLSEKALGAPLSALWEGVNNPCPNGYRVMNTNDVLSLFRRGTLILEPNSHLNYMSMGILKNTEYPNLNLFTGVTTETDTQRDYGTVVAPNGVEWGGTSAIWVLYSETTPFGFNNQKGWEGNFKYTTHLDFGYFGNGSNLTYQLAFGSNHYEWPLGNGDEALTVSNPYNAVRCVEK